jgi:hypothetical protein
LEPLLKANLWVGSNIYGNGVCNVENATDEKRSPSDGIWNDVSSKRYRNDIIGTKDIDDSHRFLTEENEASVALVAALVYVTKVSSYVFILTKLIYQDTHAYL